jgi:hypothetical protein
MQRLRRVGLARLRAPPLPSLPRLRPRLRPPSPPRSPPPSRPRLASLASVPATDRRVLSWMCSEATCACGASPQWLPRDIRADGRANAAVRLRRRVRSTCASADAARGGTSATASSYASSSKALSATWRGVFLRARAHMGTGTWAAHAVPAPTLWRACCASRAWQR